MLRNWRVHFTCNYQFTRLPEKCRALDAWALRLLEIVNDELRADNVVPIVH